MFFMSDHSWEGITVFDISQLEITTDTFVTIRYWKQSSVELPCSLEMCVMDDEKLGGAGECDGGLLGGLIFN